MTGRRFTSGRSLIRDFYAALISELDNPANETVEESVDRAVERTVGSRSPNSEPEQDE